ncbi:MAG: penicillin-binding protein activator [Desulfobacteraceae bacterium]|nr:penicillin-binding protein activator [Desulfobacteraceae bacterium]
MPTSPPEADNLWRQAEQAQKAGKLPTAIGLWEKIVQKYPTTPRAASALNSLGEVYLNQGQPDRAVQYFDYLLYAYPRWDGINSAKLNLLRARIQMGKKKQATKDAVPLWDASASQPEIRFGLATLMIDLYGSENDVETALDWCASGFTAANTPEQKRALTKSTLDLVNRLDEGAVRKLAKKKPSDFMRVFFEYRLAAIEKEKGQADAARDRLKAALAQSPGHPLTAEIQAALRGTKVVDAPQIPLSPDKIGVLVPLNGPNAKYGDMVVRGLNMAVTDWTGMNPDSKVNLVIKDAGSESTIAVQSFEELSRKEGVFAIIGPLGLQANKAVLPLANRDGIPLLSLAQKEDDGKDTSFALHVFIDSRDLVRTLVRYCREKLKYERFACLYPEDRYGQKLSKIFAETVQEQGGTMVSSASYKEKSTDFKESLQKLMNIAKKNAPLSATEGTPFEALFIPDQVSAVSLIAPQLPYNNIVGTTLLGTNLWSEAPLVQAGGVYVDQALFATSFYPESDTPQVKSFREKYERLYNATPSYLEAQAYDALMMLLIARNSVKGTSDRNAVFQSLLQAKDFKGVAGVYTASPRGDLERQYTILQVVNGQLQQVSP